MRKDERGGRVVSGWRGWEAAAGFGGLVSRQTCCPDVAGACC